MKGTVLIVGGTGFIGSHLVDALLMSGYRVRVLDVKAERFRDPLPAVEYFTGACTNRELLCSALVGCDSLFYLAHRNTPRSSLPPLEESVSPEVNAFAELLDLARQHGVVQLVFFSSGGAVYGETQSCPIDELSACCPISSYARAKWMMEATLERFHRTQGLDYLVVRPSNPFGPRQDFRGQQGVIPIFLHRILTRQPLKIWGDGAAVKDYLFVTDLVTAVVALMERGFDNEIYNIGSGQGSSLRAIIELLQAETRCKAQVEYLSAQATDVQYNILSVKKLVARTGWQPRINLEQGLRLTHQWYKELRSATVL